MLQVESMRGVRTLTRIRRGIEGGASRALKTHRHPERSEAEGFIFPGEKARAQSKDLVAFAGDFRDGGEFLHAGPARPLPALKALPSTPHFSLMQPRSFDFGSAAFAGKNNLPLACAQDDGGFMEISAPSGPEGRPILAGGETTGTGNRENQPRRGATLFPVSIHV